MRQFVQCLLCPAVLRPARTPEWYRQAWQSADDCARRAARACPGVAMWEVQTRPERNPQGPANEVAHVQTPATLSDGRGRCSLLVRPVVDLTYPATGLQRSSLRQGFRARSASDATQEEPLRA